MSISYPERTAFFCSSILFLSNSVILCFTFFMAVFWSIDCMLILRICDESMERKSASISSFISDAVMERKLIAQYMFPISNILFLGKARLLGTIKSLGPRPLSAHHFQSNMNLSSSPMWKMSCMSLRRSFPFSGSAMTPRCLKLFSISISM